LQVTSQTFDSPSKKYESTVTVFNSSVEILVEKPLAENQMARHRKGLLLIAQFQCSAPGKKLSRVDSAAFAVLF
jgi:hypothetical protein